MSLGRLANRRLGIRYRHHISDVGDERELLVHIGKCQDIRQAIELLHQIATLFAIFLHDDEFEIVE